jgi:protein-S-isoprenylcysteine O-methyltransferase Ste14
MTAPIPLLPVLVLAGLGLAFALNTRRVAARIGRSPNTFGHSDTTHDFVGRVYRIGGVGLFVFMIARIAGPEVDAAAGVIPTFARPSLAWVGLAVMVVGSALILVAQVQMGASWRIGLGADRTGLMTGGLFRISRNPTFLGMVELVFGISLLAPTALTLGVLVMAWTAFSVQIRLEEEHLRNMHGQAYEAYRASVPRWLGIRGRALP